MPTTSRLERLFPNEGLRLSAWRFSFLVGCCSVPIIAIAIASHELLMDLQVKLQAPKIMNLDPITILGLIVGIVGLAFAGWQIQLAVDAGEDSEKKAIKQEILNRIDSTAKLTVHEIDEVKSQIQRLEGEHRDTELSVAEYRGIIGLLHKKLFSVEEELAETKAAVKFFTEINSFKKRVSDLEELISKTTNKCILNNHCKEP